jgi:hypothetical protein
MISYDWHAGKRAAMVAAAILAASERGFQPRDLLAMVRVYSCARKPGGGEKKVVIFDGLEKE